MRNHRSHETLNRDGFAVRADHSDVPVRTVRACPVDGSAVMVDEPELSMRIKRGARPTSIPLARLHRSGMDTVNDAIQLIIVVTAVAVIFATVSGIILN